MKGVGAGSTIWRKLLGQYGDREAAVTKCIRVLNDKSSFKLKARPTRLDRQARPFVTGRLRRCRECPADGDKRRVWSSVLGMSAHSKISYREFGQLLQEKLAQDEGFRNALSAECGIRRRYLFQPGLDFRQQEETAVALARQADNGWKQHTRAMNLDEMSDEEVSPDVILDEELLPNEESPHEEDPAL
jgi:hypothetical protein